MRCGEVDLIPQRNLSVLANRLAKSGGRRVPESVIDREYCLSWFLCELSRSPLRRSLAFKGGTALKRCYFGDYRFSEDLDFTLLQPLSFEAVTKDLEEVYARVREASGIVFAFDREDRHTHANSYTFYLSYTGVLPSASSVKVDITIRERIAFPIQSLSVLRGYPEYSDLPQGRRLNVYSLLEIGAEKLIALADRSRNEPRDLYDLWRLITVADLDLPSLWTGVAAKLAFRGQESAGVPEAILRKEARLRALWNVRLSNQMVVVPEFERVFREFRRFLRQYPARR